MHQAKLDRIIELSELDLSKGQGPKLQLHIAECKGLKKGSPVGGRIGRSLTSALGIDDTTPDPYVVAQVFLPFRVSAVHAATAGTRAHTSARAHASTRITC